MHSIKGALDNAGALARVIYPNTPGEIAHKGDVIKFTPSQITGKYIRPEGAFDLLQWHIHVPSEHRVHGKEYVGEVHFVHKLGNTLAVIGGFVELADYSSEFIAHMMEAIKDLAPHGHAEFHPHYDHVALELRHIPKFFKYTGSLTTPPCSEGVKWLVAEEPLFKISPTDWVLLMSKTGGNSRDTKPLRYPANTNWAQERMVAEFFNPPVAAEAAQVWDYNGVKGPEFWGVSYPMCDANLQTPINIQPESHDFEEISGTLVNGGSLPLIHYPNVAGEIKNVGDTWKFIPNDPNAGRLIRPEGSFSMIQWHLHLPSEHRINGQDYVGELHFVHKLGNSLAVVGAFISLGTESSPIISQLFTAGKDMKLNDHVAWTPDYTEVVRNLKSADKFFKYTGSLTTPPCTEGVKWMVASKAALTISYTHVLEYQSKFGFTARDTKPLKYNADLDWAKKRMAPQFFNPAAGTSLPNTTLSYNGFDGPAYWMMHTAACGGNIQTPINFVAHHPDSDAIHLVLDNSLHKYPVLSYPVDTKAVGKLKNYGDTLKFTPDTQTGVATFTRPDGIYDMIQFHFHIMSEHRVDSMEYPMEFHFVHKKGDNLAVIGAFVQLGDTTSEFILRILEAGKNLPVKGSVTFTPVYTDVVAKLKGASKFFKYTGSLTTPPCSEGVKWLVAETPLFTITAQHWKEFMEKFEYSARDTQPLRNDADYDWVSARKSDYYES